MSSTIEVFWAIVHRREGVAEVLAGSLQTPQKTVEVDDGKNVRAITIPLAAGATNVEAWAWADTGGFELAALWVLGSGYANVGTQVDTPTSESDQTPAETTPVWYHRNLSCVGPMIVDTDRAYTHATEATAAGDSAGNPTLWADGSKVNGVVSKIMLRNPGSSAIAVRAIIIQ